MDTCVILLDHQTYKQKPQTRLPQHRRTNKWKTTYKAITDVVWELLILGPSGSDVSLSSLCVGRIPLSSCWLSRGHDDVTLASICKHAKVMCICCKPHHLLGEEKPFLFFFFCTNFKSILKLWYSFDLGLIIYFQSETVSLLYNVVTVKSTKQRNQSDALPE